MATLGDLTRQHTALRHDDRDHVRRLTGSWGLLADLSFADLLLFVPSVQPGSGRPDGRVVVAGQIRPTTAQTLYHDDQFGRFHSIADRPVVALALETGERAVGEMEHGDERIQVLAVPVRRDGRVIAVVTSETSRGGLRPHGELERTYLGVFHQFLDMISDGTFPYGADEESDQGPRVGDGVVVTDGATRVTYLSPNAVSALHRAGFHANAEGRELGDMGFERDAIRTAFALRVPMAEDLERGTQVTIQTRLYPLVAGGDVTGALVLLRDVSDLRNQERLLVSMDATIREIHHRVKNNLQTVSSLLRLQGRRVEVPEAKAAIDESVRRIRSIALVHEILAQEGGDDVALGDVLQPIVRMVEEALVAPDRPIRFRVVGAGPILPANVASSLAVVLTELLQNAVEHGYPPGSDGGRITIEVESARTGLNVRVHDDGQGLPDDFDLDASPGLGLTIARTLAKGELGGQITMRPASPGTIAELSVELREA